MEQFFSAVSQAWLFVFRHMLLPITLWIVFFIILILYASYRKYLRYSQTRNLQRRRYRLHRLTITTRWRLLFMILLLIGTLTYGYYVKHRDVSTQAQITTVQKTTNKSASSRLKSSSAKKSVSTNRLRVDQLALQRTK